MCSTLNGMGWLLLSSLSTHDTFTRSCVKVLLWQPHHRGLNWDNQLDQQTCSLFPPPTLIPNELKCLEVRKSLLFETMRPSGHTPGPVWACKGLLCFCLVLDKTSKLLPAKTSCLEDTGIVFLGETQCDIIWKQVILQGGSRVELVALLAFFQVHFFPRRHSPLPSNHLYRLGKNWHCQLLVWQGLGVLSYSPPPVDMSHLLCRWALVEVYRQ